MTLDPIKAWPAFRKLVRRQLAVGAREYGSSSDRPLPETLDQIAEELADVSGWSAVAFARIEALKARAEILEAAHAPTQDAEVAAPAELQAFRLDADTAALLLRVCRTLRLSPSDVVRFAVLALAKRYGFVR